MTYKMIQTGYLLGISLLLTSIFYLFASNWQSFDRLSKILLSIGLILLFYGLHFILRKTITHQHFLSDWMLVAASIVFGIAIALIGQIYNSHADSYVLFLIWLIPVLLLAIITRYEPFYIVSYILAHITMFTFMSPSAFFPDWSGNELLGMYLVIIFINTVLFLSCYRLKLASKSLFYLSYLMFHSVFYSMTIQSELPLFYVINILYIFVFIAGIAYWYKVSPHRPLLVITSVFAALYILYKGIYWAAMNDGTLILFILLIFAAALVLISLLIVGFLKKGKTNHFLIQLVTIIITMIATIFATLAITGLFFIIFPDGTADALFFFALIVLIAPGLFTKLPVQIRYTLLGTGFLLSFITSQLVELSFYPYILLGLLALGIYVVEMKGIKVLIYILANIVITTIAIDLLSGHGIPLSIFLINLAYYFMQTKDTATKYTAFIIGYSAFLILTVFTADTWLLIVYNAAFFMTATLTVLFISRENRNFEWTVSLVFWFLFLFYKYYEYLWTLVHKSILCLVLGLLCVGGAYYIDRKKRHTQTTSRKIKYKLPLLIMIILIQFGFIGYQSISSEQLLSEGTLIKLELKPVDPRSMMQGDYMMLRYDISDIDEKIDNTQWNKKIKVVLREKAGIYQYAGYFQVDSKWNQSYHAKSGDVVMNGKMYSPHDISYGIENYFVPEGTGMALENEIDYAYVRVGKSGNAIIESVE